MSRHDDYDERFSDTALYRAFALVPVAIMAIYLALAKRLGAFEAL